MSNSRLFCHGFVGGFLFTAFLKALGFPEVSPDPVMADLMLCLVWGASAVGWFGDRKRGSD